MAAKYPQRKQINADKRDVETYATIWNERSEKASGKNRIWPINFKTTQKWFVYHLRESA
jgi:hypothetical protein